MKKITRHREKILTALEEWFRHHKESPSLEELCTELGMKRSQKATLQRWLQTMRGIDVEWEDNCERTLRLVREVALEAEIKISVTQTLRYLTSGVAQWETTPVENRALLNPALRLGMSRMYLTSLLQGDETAPSNLPEFFDWGTKPVASWSPTSEIQYLSPDVTLIEDGQISNFTQYWQVSGGDVEKEVQEKVIEDVLIYCRGHQLEEEYREFRKLIIEKPVLSYQEYRNLMSSKLRALRDFFPEVYIDLEKLTADENYHFCPRCKYVQKKRADGRYRCRNNDCDRYCAQLKLSPLPSISREKGDGMKAVTFGVHRYGTIPGIWEIKLAEELQKLGLRVTLWPEIDEYDLLVEFDKKLRWAIDVKDWSSIDEERLQKVEYRLDTKETFVVFPDEREEQLRIKNVGAGLEKTLAQNNNHNIKTSPFSGIKLRLISEIIAEAKRILEQK